MKMSKTSPKVSIACFFIIAVFLLQVPFACGAETFLREEIKQQAIDESVIAIRPGIPGKRPFWNAHSRRFIYAPSFNFKPVDGAVSYRFTATSAADNKDYYFNAQYPWSSLAPVWKQLPVGEVVLKVKGLDGDGNLIGTSKLLSPPCRFQGFDRSGYPHVRRFYRAAVFKGNYREPLRSYRRSGLLALRYLFNLDHYKKWAADGTPDEKYKLYCYPSKTIAAVMRGMATYSKLVPQDSDEALAIGRGAADYLISVSMPEGSPLEFFPPTYAGSEHTAKMYKGQMMFIYPAGAGAAYLDLYDATGEKKYLKAAVNIANTYIKTQQPAGSWFLKADEQSGKPVNDNLCVPTSIIKFLDRLATDYGRSEYKKASQRAFAWIMENPFKTFNWEGQFEDVPPTKQYRNLARGQVGNVAIYLLTHYADNPALVRQAEELIRFAEDQFVIWEKPMAQTGGSHRNSSNWVLPCVLEQYRYYVPVDASSALMIEVFSTAYEVTGKALYLARARSLANSMTAAQDGQMGRYPTIWIKEGIVEDWLNCATYCAEVMLDFSKIAE